jgi:hypothetical protein
MKLFRKREWIFSIIGLIGGLILTGYMMKAKYGVINLWIIGLTVLIGLIIIVLVGTYANKR